MNTLAGADYIIVGAGSAGCALAYRLAAAGCDVLMIEHGGKDGNWLNWKIHMPAALSYPMNMPRYDWGYTTLPENNLGGRRMACPRGKVWGGSSSVNGMVYVHGHAGDFDYWRQSGADGWGYADVLPYFIRMESAPYADKQWRGHNGLLRITRADNNILHQAFTAAGQEAGFAWTDDYNGEIQEGFCRFEQTIYRGIRWSAARAYLRPALKMPNFRIIKAKARRVIFSGTQATAVEVSINNQLASISVGREIILSASAINSPQLLMLSGIGDAGELSSHGIKIIADRSGVGDNLQDHLEAYIQQRCKKPVSLNRRLKWWRKAAIGAEWLLRQSGDGATNHFESGAFLRSPNAAYPDMQFHFLPAAMRYDGSAAAEGDGFQAHVGSMRSASRGWVKLQNANPQTPPLIQFNYMSAEADWTDFRHCIRVARDVFYQPSMAEFSGSPIAPAGDSDADLDEYIRHHAESAYHPCGTCKMGAANDKEGGGRF